MEWNGEKREKKNFNLDINKEQKTVDLTWVYVPMYQHLSLWLCVCKNNTHIVQVIRGDRILSEH